MAVYNGTVELIAGITQKNGQNFALVNAPAVQVDDTGKRLDQALSELGSSQSIAPTFNENADYSEGQYVFYEGVLYRFTEDHAAGAWLGTDAAIAVMGKDLSALQDAMDNLALMEKTETFVQGYNIYTSGADGTYVTVDPPHESPSFCYAIVKCRKYDRFILRGSGGGDPRLWCFTDNDYKILKKSSINASSARLELTAEADGYLIANSTIAYSPSLVHYYYYEDIAGHFDQISDGMDQLSADMETLDDEIEEIADALSFDTPVDLSGQTEKNYVIITDPESSYYKKWHGTGSRYCYIVAVPENGIKVSVTANATGKAEIAFLTNNTVGNNTVPAYCGGTYNLVSIPAGESQSFPLPSDCAYVYVCKNYEGTNEEPDSISFDGIIDCVQLSSDLDTLADEVDRLSADVETLQDSVDEITEALTVDTHVDFSEQTEKNYVIITDPESSYYKKWHGTSSRYCYIVAVPDNGINVSVTANATDKAEIAFLTNNTVANNTVPAYCGGTYNLVSIPAGESQSFPLPSDCAYVYVCKNYEGVIELPESMSFDAIINGSQISSDINRLSGDVDQLVDEVGQLTDDVDQISDDVDTLNTDTQKILDALIFDNPVVFADENIYPYLINTSTNKWSGNKTDGRGSYSIAVSDNALSFSITANAEYDAEIAFLQNNTHSHGSAAPLCSGTSVTTIPLGTSQTFNIPDDCKYLYIYKTDTGATVDRTPESVVFQEIVDFNQNSEPLHAKPSQIFNINLADASEYDGVISNYDTEKIGNVGYTPEVGWANRLTINKYIVCDTVSYRANISLQTAGAGVCVLGTETKYGSNHATLVQFDFGNAQVSFLTGAEGGANIDGKSIPEYTYDSFSLENLSGTEYRIEIGRVNRCVYAKVYNLTTAQLCGEKTLTIYETDSSYGGKAGAMYDYPNLGVLSGTVTFKRVSANVPYGAFAMFLGDSITEGSGLALGDVWANKCIAYLGSGLNCGRGGGYITNALACVQDVAPAVSPKYVIVTVGTNGTPTLTQFNNLINRIREVNAIPIINAIPMNTRDTAEELAAKIELVLSLNTDHCRFDVATAINHDPAQGKNSSLYNSDGLHPNAAGGTAMYNQFIADVGWIKI